MIGKIFSKTVADIITIPIRLPKDIEEAIDKAIDPKKDK